MNGKPVSYPEANPKGGIKMKCYFLVLGTILVVCVGCTTGGQHLVKQKDNYVAPPAAQMSRPGPMVDGPGPGVMMPELMQVAYHEPMESGMANAPENMTSQVRFLGPVGNAYRLAG
ncbi:MAG: hypothetical protein R3C11_19300 [Planctomycetaceae bacterium]